MKKVTIEEISDRYLGELTKSEQIMYNITMNKLNNMNQENVEKVLDKGIKMKNTINDAWMHYEQVTSRLKRESSSEPPLINYTGHSTITNENGKVIYSVGMNPYNRHIDLSPNTNSVSFPNEPITEMDHKDLEYTQGRPGVGGETFSIKFAEDWANSVVNSNQEIPSFGEDVETVTVSPREIADYAMDMATRFAIYCLDYTYQLNRWYVNGDGLNNGLTKQELYFKFLDETEW